MKKTYKLSIPYLGKVAVVTVVSFSCAISAYQLSQNSSIFSPRSKALELKNNQRWTKQQSHLLQSYPYAVFFIHFIS